MKRKKTRREWTPFVRASSVSGPAASVVVMARFPDDEVWVNSLYQVNVRRDVAAEGFPAMHHLSIKRVDKGVIHDWRDLQRIKNEIVGPEHEAVELYPAESRLVDSSNQFHLWVLADPAVRFPFGFRERLVAEGNALNTKQRPFRKDERPVDCLDEEGVNKLIVDTARRAARGD